MIEQLDLEFNFDNDTPIEINEILPIYSDLPNALQLSASCQLESAGDTACVLHFIARKGSGYRLYQQSSLAEGNWHLLMDFGIQPRDQTLQFSDSFIPPREFYRLEGY